MLFLTHGRIERVLPSWNVTPSRSLMVHSVSSSFGSADSARKGTKPSSARHEQEVVDRPGHHHPRMASWASGMHHPPEVSASSA